MHKVPRKFIVTLAVLGGLVLAYYIAYPWGSWRYKITVNVETPEGMKSGSAVWKNNAFVEPGMLGVRTHINYGARGEAIIVDLGKRGKLFALMSGVRRGPDYASAIFYDVFPLPEKLALSGVGARVRYYSGLKAGPQNLTPEQYPLLVTFKGLKDPKTVELVYDTVYEDRIVHEAPGIRCLVPRCAGMDQG